MALSTLFYITITVFIIAIILNVVAIWMASKGLTRDDNNNFIPDILEEKFAELKGEVNERVDNVGKELKDVSKAIKQVGKQIKDVPRAASNKIKEQE